LATQEEILSVKDLSVTFRQADGTTLEAVKDVSFRLSRGEVLGIVGESGAGKSTVGWGILGMIEPPHLCTGEIVVNRSGKNILSMGQQELREYRWKEVAMVFQSAMNSLDPVITVGKNFTQLLLDKHVVRSKEEARACISELFKVVDLDDAVPNMYPFELSGGMKQRVSIAMALGTNPDILIADEPTTALDTITQFSVLNLLLDLKREGQIGAMILISHDLSVQAYMVDRAMVMLQGWLIEVGSKAEVFKDPKHPYTRFLVSSLSLGKPTEEKSVSVASGATPPTSLETKGCPFANTCPSAMPRCREKFPEMIRLSETRNVACYLYGG
jgi:oligopeptide/dipeptide ABC transporter ATP-binding protein